MVNSIKRRKYFLFLCGIISLHDNKSLKDKKKISKLPEEELLKLFLETENSLAIGELYHRYIPLVYGLCLKYLTDKNKAEDAVMDIFENVRIKLPQYDVKNFRTWLYSVSKNHCLQVLRKEKRNTFIKIEDAFVENDDFFTLLDRSQTKEEFDALSHCLETLSEEQKKSIEFFYLEEKSYADIVEITGYALSKVKSYIQNGKRNLKSCLIKVLHLTE